MSRFGTLHFRDAISWTLDKRFNSKAYEDEGLKGIAQEMRQQTEALGTQKPMASVLPAIEFFHSTEPSLFREDDKPAVALLPAPAPPVPQAKASLPTHPITNKRKGR